MGTLETVVEPETLTVGAQTVTGAELVTVVAAENVEASCCLRARLRLDWEKIEAAAWRGEDMGESGCARQVEPEVVAADT